MKAQLILENGRRFTGTLFGSEENTAGEIIFTTGVVGYEELLTDPAMAGQMVIMTFPLIGNYGINFEDMESGKVWPHAVIVREECVEPSNFRNEMNFGDWLSSHGVTGLCGVDTRALTRIIRDEGVMRGVIMAGEPSDDAVRSFMDKCGAPTIAEVTAKNIYTVNEGGKKRAAFIDLGTRKSVVDAVSSYDCAVTVFPASTNAEEIAACKPEVVFVSSGPENPSDADAVASTVKALIGKFPIFGIGLGHRIIGAALGCKTERLPFGHHGGNYPVKDKKTGRVYITTQNHIAALTDLSDDVEEIFVNVNDGTCQGIKHKTLPVMSVEFTPNTLTGAQGTGHIFGNFLKEVQ